MWMRGVSLVERPTRSPSHTASPETLAKALNPFVPAVGSANVHWVRGGGGAGFEGPPCTISPAKASTNRIGIGSDDGAQAAVTTSKENKITNRIRSSGGASAIKCRYPAIGIRMIAAAAGLRESANTERQNVKDSIAL